MITYVDDFGAAGGINGGTVTFQPGDQAGPFVEREYQLLFLHAGRMAITLDRRLASAVAGRVYLLRPGGRHVYACAGPRPVRESWVAVPSRLVPGPLAAVLHRAPSSVAMSDAFTRFFELVQALIAAGFAEAPAVMVPTLTAGFRLFLAEARRPPARAGSVPPAVLLARGHVRAHLAEPLTLRDLAHAARVSGSYLSRVFRRHMGLTPMAWCWDQRVRHGVWLLHRTRTSVKEIAARTGFQTPYHFSRLVKRHTGMAPTALRPAHPAGVGSPAAR